MSSEICGHANLFDCCTAICVAFLNRLFKCRCRLIIDNHKRLVDYITVEDTKIETEFGIKYQSITVLISFIFLFL